jgi:hypothetical protein
LSRYALSNGYTHLILANNDVLVADGAVKIAFPPQGLTSDLLLPIEPSALPACPPLVLRKSLTPLAQVAALVSALVGGANLAVPATRDGAGTLRASLYGAGGMDGGSKVGPCRVAARWKRRGRVHAAAIPMV